MADAIGYVYVMKSSRSNDLKIGYTTTSIEQRERELHTTGLASPLKAVFFIIVKNPADVEQTTHQLLIEKRVASNREFFNCTIKEATSAILQAATILDYKILEKWSEEKNLYEIQNELPKEILINFPEIARPYVVDTFESKKPLIKKHEHIAQILLTQLPQFQDKKNLNQAISWWNKVTDSNISLYNDLIFAAEEDSYNFICLPKEDEIRISNWCSALPADVTKLALKNLSYFLYDYIQEQLVFRKNLTLELKKISESLISLLPDFQSLIFNDPASDAVLQVEALLSNQENALITFSAKPTQKSQIDAIKHWLELVDFGKELKANEHKIKAFCESYASFFSASEGGLHQKLRNYFAELNGNDLILEKFIAHCCSKFEDEHFNSWNESVENRIKRIREMFLLIQNDVAKLASKFSEKHD